MRPIFKQIAELIGGAAHELRLAIDPRIMALEKHVEAAALEREATRKKLEELPALDDVLVRVLKAVPQPQPPDVSAFITAERAQELIRADREKHATTQPDVKDIVSQVLDFIEAPDTIAIAKTAAEMVHVEPLPDMSEFVRTSQMKDALEKALDEVGKHLPTPEDVAKFAVELIPEPKIPDVSGFMTCNEVQILIAADREKHAVEPLTDDHILRTVEALIPKPVDVEAVAKAAAALVPIPKDGKDGDPGETFTLEQVQALVAKAVASVKMPTAEDVAASLDATHLAKWALDFERRAQDLMQRTIDRIPVPKDGADGLGFDDMDVEFDGDRTVTLSFVKGERRKSKSFKLPTMIYRDVYDEAKTYERGDVVTWGGSSWVSLKETPQGKPGQSHDWQLMVKKGRDGSSK